MWAVLDWNCKTLRKPKMNLKSNSDNSKKTCASMVSPAQLRSHCWSSRSAYLRVRKKIRPMRYRIWGYKQKPRKQNLTPNVLIWWNSWRKPRNSTKATYLRPKTFTGKSWQRQSRMHRRKLKRLKKHGRALVREAIKRKVKLKHKSKGWIKR